jgi:hypothetical protein
MTHFILAVIVPDDELDDLDDFVAAQLAPYDEDVRVAPYVCYSPTEARADIEATIARLERTLAAGHPEQHHLETCRNMLDEYRSLTPEAKYREFLRCHDRFNDRGEPISTYNPASKWDWYVVGGRWDGWLHGREASGRSLDNNLAPAAHLLEHNLVPFTILTPDGCWHERGRMCWFAVVTDEKDDWDAEARALFERFRDHHHVVVVDCHI